MEGNPTDIKKKIAKAYKAMVAMHGKSLRQGQLAPCKKLAQHQIAMKNYSLVEAKFLTPGKYEAINGKKYEYDWPVLARDKDTFKGKTFYVSHLKQKTAMEFGIIKKVYAKTIEGKKWLVAQIKIPEISLTQNLLARIQQGLTKHVSSTHNFTVEEGTDKVNKIMGSALSAESSAEVKGAKFIEVKRNLKA